MHTTHPHRPRATDRVVWRKSESDGRYPVINVCSDSWGTPPKHAIIITSFELALLLLSRLIASTHLDKTCCSSSLVTPSFPFNPSLPTQSSSCTHNSRTLKKTIDGSCTIHSDDHEIDLDDRCPHHNHIPDVARCSHQWMCY